MDNREDEVFTAEQMREVATALKANDKTKVDLACSMLTQAANTYDMLDALSQQIVDNAGELAGFVASLVGFGPQKSEREKRDIPPTPPIERKEEHTLIARAQGECSPEAVFRKPTLEEVASYCRSRNNSVNAQYFLDFYESKGWKVGRNKMRDWKAAVRTWERRSEFGNVGRGGTSTCPRPTIGDIEKTGGVL